MNVFPIAPAESRYLWLLIPVGLILVGAMALLVTSVRGAHASRFEIRSDGLRLEGYSLLLSPADPDGFLSQLRSLSP